VLGESGLQLLGARLLCHFWQGFEDGLLGVVDVLERLFKQLAERFHENFSRD
jgi:hypothetical protein